MQRLFLPAPLTLSLMLLASCNVSQVEAPADGAIAEIANADPANADPANADTTQRERQADSTTVSSANSTDAIAQASRVVALTSLSADLVQTLDPERLVGVPGSSLIRNDARFQGITPVSEERVPPNLETIISLKPDLVIGAVGFHDQALQRLQELQVPTLAVEIDGWEELENLTQDLAKRLNADAQPLQQRYQACLQGSERGNSRSVLVLSGQAPILSPNKASWAGEYAGHIGSDECGG
ncbi:MAG: ABC transporter substrate-binding protein [Synechococcales cyanobacterium CRU_2_2]|nr:ABC transporter substrate-binding protein [Synechococcales cyanobacterium CRU_2_2]